MEIRQILSLAEQEADLSSCSFDELLEIIEGAQKLSLMTKELRDRALIAADKTGPYADRKAMGRAANLYPSSLSRLLVRHGRPSNRRTGD